MFVYTVAAKKIFGGELSREARSSPNDDGVLSIFCMHVFLFSGGSRFSPRENNIRFTHHMLLGGGDSLFAPPLSFSEALAPSRDALYLSDVHGLKVGILRRESKWRRCMISLANPAI